MDSPDKLPRCFACRVAERFAQHCNLNCFHQEPAGVVECVIGTAGLSCCINDEARTFSQDIGKSSESIRRTASHSFCSNEAHTLISLSRMFWYVMSTMRKCPHNHVCEFDLENSPPAAGYLSQKHNYHCPSDHSVSPATVHVQLASSKRRSREWRREDTP